MNRRELQDAINNLTHTVVNLKEQISNLQDVIKEGIEESQKLKFRLSELENAIITS